MSDYDDRPSLEKTLKNSTWLVDKVRSSEVYAQNLYAAMCNNQFIPMNAWHILNERYWSCSWRYAGGIISDMVEHGNYMDWYCSGIAALEGDAVNNPGFVPESQVTEEIRKDLGKLGWLVRPYEDDDS